MTTEQIPPHPPVGVNGNDPSHHDEYGPPEHDDKNIPDVDADDTGDQDDDDDDDDHDHDHDHDHDDCDNDNDNEKMILID